VGLDGGHSRQGVVVGSGPEGDWPRNWFWLASISARVGASGSGGGGGFSSFGSRGDGGGLRLGSRTGCSISISSWGAPLLTALPPCLPSLIAPTRPRGEATSRWRLLNSSLELGQQTIEPPDRHLLSIATVHQFSFLCYDLGLVIRLLLFIKVVTCQSLKQKIHKND
jgi:hypothetical protein